MQNRLIEDNIDFFRNLQNLIVNRNAIGKESRVFTPALRLITLALEVYGSDFWGTASINPKSMISPIIKEGRNVASMLENELKIRPEYLSAVIKSLSLKGDVGKTELAECVSDSMAFLLMSNDKISRYCAYEFIFGYITQYPEDNNFIPTLFHRFGGIMSKDAGFIEKNKSLCSIMMYGVIWTINCVKKACENRILRP